MRIALGLEGSANKLGVGIIAHPEHGPARVLSNLRHTFITPPGEGFQPNHTAKHHKEHICRLIREAMSEAGLTRTDLDCICYVRAHPPIRLFFFALEAYRSKEGLKKKKCTGLTRRNRPRDPAWAPRYSPSPSSPAR